MRNYSGLSIKAASPSICTLLSSTVGIPLIGVFIFTRFIIQHFRPLGELSRDLLCNWSFTSDVSVSDLFVGGSKVVRKLDGAFRMDWLEGSVMIFLEVSDIVSSLMLSILPLLSSSALVGIILVTLLPLLKGVWFFWSNCFTMVSDVLRRLLPAFWSGRRFTKKILWGSLTFSLVYFYCIFPFIVWGGDI